MAKIPARRIALYAFLLLTLAFFFASAAAVQYYLEVIRSIRTVEIHLSSFEVIIVDRSNGTFSFRMTLVNPSGAPLKVQLLSYTLYLNGRLVGARAADYSVQELRITARSDRALAVSTRLMAAEVNAILQSTSNVVWNWQLKGTLRLRTAVDSDFQISFAETWSRQPLNV